MRQVRSGGGWKAIGYSLRLAFRVGPLRFYRAMASKNACKTCAFGMGGQLGGMRNEQGRFPEVCKKSMQAMAADMAGRIDPKLFNTYSIQQLQSLSSRELEAFGRLADPVILEPEATHYQVIGWDEAFDRIGTAMKQTDPDNSFFYASGRSSNEAGFLLNLLARAYGTNNVNNCSYYCHQASAVGLMDSLGTPVATIELDDIDKCDLFFLIGGNTASNHPRLTSLLTQLRRQGGRVIVVNPLKETGLVNFRVPSNMRSLLRGSDVASVYVQPTIGGDIALFAGIAKALIEHRQTDLAFIREHTEGFEAVRDLVENLSWEEVEQGSGLDRDTIHGVAQEYASSERTIFAWTMGITHHLHGVENVQWIANLALLRGMLGKPGAGLLPIRGHSNVQGMGTVGVSPYMAKAAVEGLQSLGLKLPVGQGRDTMSTMEAARAGQIRFGLCLGGNLYGANPDSAFSKEALAKVDTLVYLSTSLNTGHAHGVGKTTLILPVLVRDEEQQSTTQESMFSYVRLSDGGAKRHEGPRSEVEILCEVGTRVDEQVHWEKLKSHDEVRALVARLVPKLAPIGEIGKTKQEFHIPGRILHEPSFATKSGRGRFHAAQIPACEPLRPNQLRLMTIRSEGQFNTVVYEDEDIYRGQERRDLILMNPQDLSRLRLTPDQAVIVSSACGSMTMLARTADIAPGCAAMYYPEANVLVARAVDPRSGTPAFKSTVISIAPSPGPDWNGKVHLKQSSSSGRRGMKAC